MARRRRKEVLEEEKRKRKEKEKRKGKWKKISKERAKTKEESFQGMMDLKIISVSERQIWATSRFEIFIRLSFPI